MVFITSAKILSTAVLGAILFAQPLLSQEKENKASLLIVQKLLKKIKKDKYNRSFREMIKDRVMKEHALSYHKMGQPYFYSDDHYVITDIINFVLDHPDGIIDQTGQSGILVIYREFDYSEEVEELFDREERSPGKFQEAYLGQTINGPTNKVAVLLKVKGDEQNEDTLEKRLAYMSNNIQYVTAYPIKGFFVKSEDSEPEKDGEEEIDSEDELEEDTEEDS